MSSDQNLESSKKVRPSLLPDRMAQGDLFVCDIFDSVPLKSEAASMEHPLFTMSTKPDMTVKEYKRGDVELKLTPSPVGRATVHDRDILIYCISHLMRALNEGMPVSKTVRFTAHDLLLTTNRQTSRRGYELFKNALKRLQGTQIETNLTTGGKEQWDVFSFIESARTVRETRDGRMEAIEITLSDWVFNAIEKSGRDILTISRDYFRLRKPLERRLYEIARKKCGRNPKWSFKLDTLHEMTGSGSPSFEFKRMVKAIVRENEKNDHFPDYTIELEGDLVTFRTRQSFKDVYVKPKGSGADKIQLPAGIHEKARKFANGWDVYHLEEQWRSMLSDKDAKVENPAGSFIGFVKWYAESNGAAR